MILERRRMLLPSWMRRALVATGVMNLAAALASMPSVHGMRSMAGVPEDGPPIYLATVGVFIGIFGLGYLWLGMSGRDNRLFLACAAAGKMSFFLLLVMYWWAGELPWRAPLLGSADLVFGSLFLKWLLFR
jgi:hypothetical protein